MQSKTWVFLVGAFFLVFLTSCGGGSNGCTGIVPSVEAFSCTGGSGGGGTGVTPVYVYAIDNTSKLHAASLANGTIFTELTSLSLPTLGVQSFDMIVVGKKFLYVSGISGSNGVVFGYTINSASGGLTAINGTPLLTGTQAGFSVAADPLGRFLYVGDGGGRVAAFTINSSTGALTATANSPFLLDPITGLGISYSLAVDKTGNYLYVGQGPNARNGLIADVFGFTINQTTGILSPVVGEPFGLGVGLLDVAPTLPYVVGTSDTAGDNRIYSMTVGQTGVLAPIVGFATLNTPNRVLAHPGGKYVYALEDGQFAGNTLEIFSMDSGGNLTLVNGSPVTDSESLMKCKTDQSGNWIFCATAASKVAVLGVNTGTGALNSSIPSIAMGNGSLLAVTD